MVLPSPLYASSQAARCAQHMLSTWRRSESCFCSLGRGQQLPTWQGFLLKADFGWVSEEHPHTALRVCQALLACQASLTPAIGRTSSGWPAHARLRPTVLKLCFVLPHRPQASLYFPRVQTAVTQQGNPSFHALLSLTNFDNSCLFCPCLVCIYPTCSSAALCSLSVEE